FQAEDGIRDFHVTGVQSVLFRSFDKYTGEACSGAFMHVTDVEAFRPLRTGVAIVQAARELAPNDFRWRADAYEFVDDVPAFDLLCGTDQVRVRMEAGRPLDELLEGFDAASERFRREREAFLLYA